MRSGRCARRSTCRVSAIGREVTLPLQARAVSDGRGAVTLGAEGQGMVAGDLVNTAADSGGGRAGRRVGGRGDAAGDGGGDCLRGRRQLRAEGQGRAGASIAGWAGDGRRGRGRCRSEGLEPPFVGRERELRLVKELFHAIGRGAAGALVSVVGIAGIGKSRLAWEFSSTSTGWRTTVFWHRGRCLAYGEGVATGRWRRSCACAARIVEGEDAGRGAAKLHASRSRTCSRADERAWVEPRLAHLLGLEERATPTATTCSRPGGCSSSGWRRRADRVGVRGHAVGRRAMLASSSTCWSGRGSHPIFVLALSRPELRERDRDFARRRAELRRSRSSR